jgi:hypothetical protein
VIFLTILKYSKRQYIFNLMDINLTEIRTDGQNLVQAHTTVFGRNHLGSLSRVTCGQKVGSDKTSTWARFFRSASEY